jgi:hypothetical protein
MNDVVITLSFAALLAFCVFNLCLTIALIRERRPRSIGIGGPQSGAPLPSFSLETLDGPLTSEHTAETETVLVLAEESCSSCKVLLEDLANVIGSRKSPLAMRVIVAWSGEGGDNVHLRALRDTKLNIELFQYGGGLSPLGRTLGFNGSPGACEIDSKGLVASSGVASILTDPLKRALAALGSSA